MPAAIAVALLGAGTAWAALEPEAGSPYAVGAEPYAVYAADFSGDGRPDVAVLNGTSSNVNIFLRQPGGGFVQEAGSPVGVGSGPSYAAVGDYNGDGRPDLAVANFVSGGVTVLLRQAGGGFAPETPPDYGPRASAIAAADFNSDGRVDLAVAEWDSNRVTVLLRNANNTGFFIETSPGTGVHPRQIAVADYNGDSRPDLAVANADSANVTVLLRNSTGGFVSEGAAIAVGTAPAGIAAADLDGDRRPDLAVTSYGTDSVSVLLRRATNDGFAEESGSPIAVGDGPVGIVAADLTVDGRVDLAVAANGGAVEVLRRNAGTGFTRDPATAVAGGPNGVAAADFDGDTRPDLAVSSLVTNTLTILRNPAPPQPPTPTPTPTPTSAPVPTATPLPSPTAGKTVNVIPKSGSVRVKPRGSDRYVDLEAGQQIPVGSSVDTRKGRVEIDSAGGGQADFSQGLFRISQGRGVRPLTTLKLIEPLNCPRRGRAGAAARKKTRKLFGDGRGRFRTDGNYAAATVRGTRWLVQDRCDSTLTKVTEGSVSVHDKVTGKTKLVRAGGKYTARRRR